LLLSHGNRAIIAGNHSAPEQQGAAGPLLAAPGNLRCGISGVLLATAVNQVVVGSAKLWDLII